MGVLPDCLYDSMLVCLRSPQVGKGLTHMLLNASPVIQGALQSFQDSLDPRTAFVVHVAIESH
jgi:hypothetical protein